MSVKLSEALSKAELQNSEKTEFFQTYKRSSLIPVRGEGVYLYDEEGNSYLDLVSGLGVNALGHAHPEIIEAVTDQYSRFSHLSNGFINTPQVVLAGQILKAAPEVQRVFFTNSGTEAVEGAIKLVRRWAKKHNKEDIVAFSKGFHGRSLGALSLTYKQAYRDGYGPFMPEVKHLQFDSLKDLSGITEKTAAVFLEFVQGEGGIRPISCEFADELDRLHKKYGFLLIADEIQAGVGRTGQFFSYQWYTLKPDLVVCAKPIGGGLPLGVILGKEPLSELWEPGSHGTTFGGNPVSCAAGAVVMNWLFEQNGLSHVKTTGNLFLEALKQIREQVPGKVKSVRAFGLMGALELTEDSSGYPAKALREGLIINSTDSTVIRLLPPLIITDIEINEMKEKLIRILK